MSAEAILKECAHRGVELIVKPDGGLRVKAPQGSVDEKLRTALQTHKEDVIRLIEAKPDNFYDREICRVLDELGQYGRAFTDYPAATRHRAFELEQEITEAANAGNRGAFLDFLNQWRRCFH